MILNGKRMSICIWYHSISLFKLDFKDIFVYFSNIYFDDGIAWKCFLVIFIIRNKFALPPIAYAVFLHLRKYLRHRNHRRWKKNVIHFKDDVSPYIQHQTRSDCYCFILLTRLSKSPDIPEAGSRHWWFFCRSISISQYENLTISAITIQKLLNEK